MEKGNFKERKNEIEERENEIEERENEIEERENEIEERKNKIKDNKFNNVISSILLFVAGTALTFASLAPYATVTGLIVGTICGGVVLSSIGCGLFHHFIIKKNKDELSNIKQSLKDDKETLKDDKETLKDDKETLKDELLTAQNKEIDSLRRKVKVMQAVNVSTINTLAENKEELTI